MAVILGEGDYIGEYGWVEKELHEIGGVCVITVLEGGLKYFREIL